MKGAAKEKVGHAADNKRMESEGTAEKATGKAQQKTGDAKKSHNK